MEKPEDWPWSGFRNYATGEEGGAKGKNYAVEAPRGYIVLRCRQLKLRFWLKESAMHAEPLRPSTKANSRNRRDWCCCGLALVVLCMLAGPVSAQNCSENASCQPRFKFNGYDKGAKTVINNCTTNDSSSPCAWADAFNSPENFLACSLENTGPIALCYYSGVPGSPYFTPSCTFSQDKNAAECDCYELVRTLPTRRLTLSY